MMPRFSVLAPAAGVYGYFMARRRRRFTGRPATRLKNCAVISVGNLTVGGTGKTPAVQYIARLLQENGARVAIVSRGYGGTLAKRGAIVSDGQRIFREAREVGDEPLLHARALPGVPVVVGIDRVRAAQVALEKFAPDVIVLDDAFQFYSLYRDLNIVLLDARRPLGNGHLLPRGTLREEAAALHRADVLLLTRADRATPQQLSASREKLRPSSDAPIYEAAHAPAKLLRLNFENVPCETTPREHSLDWLRGKTVGAASALADNAAFRATLETLGARVVTHCARRDHHKWREAEIIAAAREGAARGASALLVTEKDAVKISRDATQKSTLPIVALGIELRVMSGESELRDLITQVASTRGAQK